MAENILNIENVKIKISKKKFILLYHNITQAMPLNFHITYAVRNISSVSKRYVLRRL